MRSTISVVIVAGACGIAAGTPLAILGAIGRSAQLGSIIKGGLYLEALATIDTVLLDKTGTLTYGRPSMTAIHDIGGLGRELALQYAASLERYSKHPLGSAILAAAEAEGLPLLAVEDVSEAPGAQA